MAAVHRETEGEGVRRAVADAHLPAGAVEVEALDVRDEARARELLAAREPWGLVNNAAVVNAGLLVDVPIEDAREQFEVMVFAPLRLASSPSRRCAGPAVAASSTCPPSPATRPRRPSAGTRRPRAALSTLSSVLRQEVAHLGIEVVAIEPGIIDTDIWDKAADDLRRRRGDALEPEPYGRASRPWARRTAAAPVSRRSPGPSAPRCTPGIPGSATESVPAPTPCPSSSGVVPTGLRDRVARAAAAL